MSSPFPHVVKAELSSRVLEADVRVDGDLVAVALFNPNGDHAPIRVLRSKDLSQVSEYGPTNANGRAVCFTHGGTKLHYLVASEENPSALHLHRVDLSTGKDTLITPYSRRNDAPERLIRNADGSMMAVLGRMAEVWDLTSDKVIRRIPLRTDALPSDSMRGAFSFTGPTLFLHGHEPDHVVHVDVLDGKTRARYRAPTDEPGAVAVSPDGKYPSVCGCSGKSAYVYDTERGRVAEDTFDDGMGH